MLPYLDLRIGSKPAKQEGTPSSSLSRLRSPGKSPSPGDRIYTFPAFGLSDDEDNNFERVGRDHALFERPGMHVGCFLTSALPSGWSDGSSESAKQFVQFIAFNTLIYLWSG